MNTNRLTEQQCIRIIENNYLGTPDKRGKQKDYHDYKFDIDKRLWELQDKKHGELLQARNEFLDEPTPSVNKPVFNRPFKLGIRWDLIAKQCNGMRFK